MPPIAGLGLPEGEILISLWVSQEAASEKHRRRDGPGPPPLEAGGGPFVDAAPAAPGRLQDRASMSGTQRLGTRQTHDRPVIGWREWATLPAFGVPRIKVKIDTGARTSSIHAFRLRTFSDGGTPHVSFEIHPEQRRKRGTVECVAEVRDQRLVRSSTGHQQLRYVIRTEVGLAGLVVPIDLTLANRDEMGFRMLLGRAALRRRFLVDPGKSFIAGLAHADVETQFVRKAS